MSFSRLDKIYRSILLTKFFTKGWGTPESLYRIFEFRKIISDRAKCFEMVPKNYPVSIISNQTSNGYQIIEGKFLSPFAIYMRDVVPVEVSEAYFQVILPREWKSKYYKPVCVHFAGTGDHFFWRRRNLMAKPLAKRNVGSVLLENPFYGLRKPAAQIRSSLHNVCDIFIMGGCLIMECLVILHWCERMGLGPLGVSGISMGGHMASLAATNWPKPLVLVPCLSWSTASSVFTEGVMSDAINWDLLQNQFNADKRYHEILSKLCFIIDNPFQCSLLSNMPVHSGDQQFLELDFAISESITNTTTSRGMSPYDLMSIIRASASNCAAFSCKDSNENRLSSMMGHKLTNLIKHIQMLLSNVTMYSEMKKNDKEALWFMRGVMDECTHLKNFSVPFDTDLVIAICAKSDAYVPRQGCSNLEDLWPGSTVRFLDTGHVGAYIWHRQVFRNAIVEAFERAKNKYPPPL